MISHFDTPAMWGWLNALTGNNMTGRLAVYGTLRKGGRLHNSYLRGMPFVKEMGLLGKLYHLPHAGFPVAVYDPTSKHTFVVEIYTVTIEMLLALYHMETGVGIYDAKVLDIEGVPTGLFAADQFGEWYAKDQGVLLDSGDFTCTGLLSMQRNMTSTNDAQQGGTNDT